MAIPETRSVSSPGITLSSAGAIIVRNSFSRAALLGNSGGWILEAVRMDGLLGRNWIATRECIFYSSSSTFSPRLRSASSLIFVMNFSNFCCDSVCSISIGSPIFPPPLRHCDRPHGSVPCKCQCFDCGGAVFTAFCTFSNELTSIWRTRSLETPNSAAKSASVIGSSASRRASKMRRSRSLSTQSARHARRA